MTKEVIYTKYAILHIDKYPGYKKGHLHILY